MQSGDLHSRRAPLPYVDQLRSQEIEQATVARALSGPDAGLSGLLQELPYTQKDRNDPEC